MPRGILVYAMSKCKRIQIVILHAVIFFHLAYSADTLVAKENTAVTLTCPLEDRKYISRRWYRGYFTDVDAPHPFTSIIFTQLISGAVENHTARADLSIDPTSFALTIRRVQLEDDGFYTCKVFDGVILQDLYDQTQVEVYIQPTIEMTGVNPTHKENDTVSVTCKIDRLYPQIQPSNFTMRWGDTVREAVGVKNNDPDKSYRYGVQITKTLTKEDNRMTVTCNVNPVRGTPMSEQRTLNVHYPSKTAGPPPWLPVVAGVSACVMIITIVIIAVACCIKRRNRNTIELVIYSDEPQGEMNNHIETNQRNTTANLPDVAQDLYEEIHEPAQMPIAHSDEPPADHQYEMLQHRPKNKFEDWMENNNISESIQDKLHRHAILSIDDLKALTDNDLLELGLNIGDRNRLKKALRKLGVKRDTPCNVL